MSDANTLVAELEAATADQPKMPLRHHQITAYQDELRRLGHMTENRDIEGHKWAEPLGVDPTAANRRVREVRKILAEQAPKKISGPKANQVYALLNRVKTEVIQPTMLPQEVMRRSPTGAVGEYQRRECHPFYKRAALAVKRAIRGLDPENPDPDLTNLERFRPSNTGPNGTSTFRTDAIIPGNFAFGAQAKANWPLGEPTAETALAQVQQREAREANGHGRRTAKGKAKREKRPASPAQLAAIAKAQAALAAKRAGGEAPVPAEA